jgi:hypothetical protein
VRFIGTLGIGMTVGYIIALTSEAASRSMD